MPAYELALPPDAYNIKLKKAMSQHTKTYAIDPAVAGFTRTGEDDDTIIIPLFGGDEFVGEVLEGHWKKGWSSGMDAAQAFTAIIDGAGTLELEGEADVAGTYGYGWLNSHHPIPLMDEIEITVSMQLPVDDTGVTAARDIMFNLILGNKLGTASQPSPQNDWIRIYTDVDEDGLYIVAQKNVATVTTNLHSIARTTGDIEARIWRLVFHDGHYGAASPSDKRHLHIYSKVSDTIANAESETETELSTSPFNISDILFDVAYLSLEIGSQNTTYFDSGNEAKSTYVRVDYPDFDIIYDIAEADRHEDEVELWDGDPDSGGVKVYDVDHAFSNDIYLQNGLVRVFIDETTDWYFQSYSAGSWQIFFRDIYMELETDNKQVYLPHLMKIIYLSPEKCVIRIKLTDTATNDDDYYWILDITLERGKPYHKFEVRLVHPLQRCTVGWFEIYEGNIGYRFGYAGDVDTEGIADNDLTLTINNDTLTDNVFLMFDDDGELWLAGVTTSKKPDFSASYDEVTIYDGRALRFYGYKPATLLDAEFYVFCSPFSLVANLFEEAEDGNLAGGATTDSDAGAMGASGNSWVVLDAQNEEINYQITAGTDLPEGRYLAVWRIQDLNQVASDVILYAWNSTDSTRREEIHAEEVKTATGAWAFYSYVFDILSTDISDGDTIAIGCKKATANANEIYVDYVLLVPIGDGESLPQDLTHAVMRDVTKARRVFKR